MDKIKKYKKNSIILLIIYCIALISVLQSNYNYIDDMGRVVWGYTAWGKGFSRWLSDITSYFVHAGFYLSDISPLPQILAIIIIITSSILLLYIVTEKETNNIWEIIAVVPLGLSPYFLECLSYKYDAPYMALSVLVSIIPVYIYIKYKKYYCITSFVGTMMMCLTYQAASGILPMLTVYVCLKKWNKKDEIKEIFKFLIMTLVGYVAGLMIFRSFIMQPVDDYVSSTIGSPKIWTQNYIRYFINIGQDLKKIWILLIILISFGFVYGSVRNTQRKKIVSLIYSSIALTMMLLLMFGVYPLLTKPSMNARAMFGVGIYIAIINVAAVDLLEKSKIIKLFVTILMYNFVVLALTYGNALTEQNQYDDFRIQEVVNALNNTKYLKTEDKKKIQVEGSVGYAPAIKNTVWEYPVLKKLIPITFQGNNWSWGSYKLLCYYNIKNIIPNGKTDLKKKKLKRLKESANYTILGDQKNILIKLR